MASMLLKRLARCTSLASLALLMLAVCGCGSSDAKLPAASVPGPKDAESGSHAKADPATLLAQMVAVYKEAKTYADVGDVRISAQDEKGQKETSPSIPFSVAFERPNKVRIHSFEASVVADGEHLRAFASSYQGQVLSLKNPELLALADLETDALLVEAMRGQLKLAMPQLALLMSDDPIRSLAGDGQPELLAEAKVGNEMCDRVGIKSDAGMSVFWIARTSHLLLKYEFPSDAFRQEYSVADASIVADFKGARVNADIPADAFKFDVPEGAKLLTRLLEPAPDAPPALLGKKPVAYSFVDYRGGNVSQESLAGKVVVLDLWATWCGWCFEGFPNLQKVYDQFKDNDKVVILAVNTDEVTVTDEQVKASFQKAGLSIPIVRDTQRASEAFDVKGLPTMLILGPDGTVEDYHVGYDPRLATTLPRKLERLLAGESLSKEELANYASALEAYQKLEADALAPEAGAAEK